MQGEHEIAKCAIVLWFRVVYLHTLHTVNHSDVHVFCLQDLRLTSSLERCIQVPVKSTQTFTAVWMWWRRCGFRFHNTAHIQRRGLKASGLGMFVPKALSAPFLNIGFLSIFLCPKKIISQNKLTEKTTVTYCATPLS